MGDDQRITAQHVLNCRNQARHRMAAILFGRPRRYSNASKIGSVALTNHARRFRWYLSILGQGGNAPATAANTRVITIAVFTNRTLRSVIHEVQLFRLHQELNLHSAARQCILKSRVGASQSGCQDVLYVNGFEQLAVKIRRSCPSTLHWRGCRRELRFLLLGGCDFHGQRHRRFCSDPGPQQR